MPLTYKLKITLEKVGDSKNSTDNLETITEKVTSIVRDEVQATIKYTLPYLKLLDISEPIVTEKPTWTFIVNISLTKEVDAESIEEIPSFLESIDEDGNYPVKYNGGKYLLRGKCKQIQ